jgi:hypothetical protein
MDNGTSLLDILEAVAQDAALENGISVPLARYRARASLLDLGALPPDRRTWEQFAARLSMERGS